MIALMLALLAPASPQAVEATLTSCAMEQGRWVCRYEVPAVEIIPFTGDATQYRTTPSQPGANDVEPIPTERAEVDTPPPTVTVPSTTAAPLALDRGVLSERQAALVARCADAGWVSFCLPADRRSARVLQADQSTYQAVRRTVTGMLGEDRCDEAIRTALDRGYLGLAREARDFCAAPPADTATAQVPASPPT